MKRKSFDFGDFEITIREILASVSIIAVMLLIGFVISGKISNHILDQNERYNKAVKIEDSELFEYGMRTNIGDAFVYGQLQAVDPVSYPEIEGSYISIAKCKERYTEHVRTVTKTDSNGNQYTETETYWTWDRIGTEEKTCSEINFLGHVFSSDKFDLPSKDYIDTLMESYYIRYVYYGVGSELNGTIFTTLSDQSISCNSAFYENLTIDETLKKIDSKYELVCFWLVWTILIVIVVFGFYYIDNDWLED